MTGRPSPERPRWWLLVIVSGVAYCVIVLAVQQVSGRVVPIEISLTVGIVFGAISGFLAGRMTDETG